MRGLIDLNRTVPGAERPERMRLCIMGSTGSIGVSALEVARRHPEHIHVHTLAAGGNVELLARQIAEFRPVRAAVRDPQALSRLAEILRQEGIPAPELYAGDLQGAEIAAADEVDVVLAAIVGLTGLRSVLAALKAGKRVALANKESLVAGGALVREAMQPRHAMLVPVDSEHSALFQLLEGEPRAGIARLILTASGGPFLKTPAGEFAAIDPARALQHPRWKMGPKISIDSATMMNKALEVIEAHWLFGAGVDEIDVLVHPQSIVHSLVELTDGSQQAHLSVPDMKGAIAYGLLYPEGRLPGVMRPLNLAAVGTLEFLPLDHEKFPAVTLAREALRAGGAASAVFNIANEAAVNGFLQGALRFDQIVPFAARALERYAHRSFDCLEALLALDAEVRNDLTGMVRGT